MSNLENLRRFLNDNMEESIVDSKVDNIVANTVTGGEESSIQDNQIESKKASADVEVESNTAKESKASLLCKKIFYWCVFVSIILVILCIVVKGPFLGDGIRYGNIVNILSNNNLNTIIANLMVRSVLLSVYMSIVYNLVSRMTCRVCSNFFTGRNKVWSKYKDTNVETERTRTTTYYGFNSSRKNEETSTYHHNFNVLYQCKYCGKMYAGIETKKTRSRQVYYD